jgi:hypothetical protein
MSQHRTGRAWTRLVLGAAAARHLQIEIVIGLRIV